MQNEYEPNTDKEADAEAQKLGSACYALSRLRLDEMNQKAKQNPHRPGIKLDSGKNRLGLVLRAFSRALEGIGEVGTFGVNKYTENGWVEVDNAIARYTDAMYRHLLKDAQGELYDTESGLPHLHHALWNLAAVVELIERERDQ